MRSLRARLLLGAMLWIALGFGVAGISISALFRSHVTEIVNAELIGHLDELERLLERHGEGALLARRLSDPRFAQAGTGFYWQVSDGRGVVLRSSSLTGAEQLPLAPPAIATLQRRVEPGPDGTAIVYSRPWHNHAGRPLTLQVGADQRLIDDVLAHFNRALALSLGLLAGTLVLAAGLQTWIGLLPLRRLRTALGAVRTGQAQDLAGTFPTEVQPLVADLNALLDANTQMIRRARTQAGNLAHGLKTPLAILSDEARRLAARGDREGAAVLAQQCERMQRQIDYQLARTRAAAAAGLPGVITPLAPALAAIAEAMGRLHAARDLTITLDVPAGLSVAVDRRDLDEMVANLVDNGCKWASRTVSIGAAPHRGSTMVTVRVEDDGEGIPDQAIDRVFELGERLDEDKPGSGLGLAIVRDLAGLHGGGVALSRRPGGGLRADLTLPAA